MQDAGAPANGQHNGDADMRQLIADILNATAATGRTECTSSEDLEVQEDLLRQQHRKSQTGIFDSNQILAYC